MARRRTKTASTKSDSTLAARVATSATGMSAIAMYGFAEMVGPQKVEELISELKERNRAITEGKTEGLEAMLMGQAIALQAIFANLAHRSALNAGQNLQATETYMKLALRAQSQVRATLETLALIRNPPVVYARQANISSGPQQINNGIARETESVQTQLLEAHLGERLDTGTKSETGRVDSGMEAVGAVNRP